MTSDKSFHPGFVALETTPMPDNQSESNRILPTADNNCQGTFEDGSLDSRHKCRIVGSLFGCVGWRYFLASCTKPNLRCSGTSGAFLPAAAVCRQKLF